MKNVVKSTLPINQLKKHMDTITILAILAAAAGGGVALHHKFSPSYQEKRAKREQERELEEEKERKVALQKQDRQWEEVNHSPWWIWGIPEKANLVLDAQLLYDKSPTMAFWFKMVQDNAEDRDWNVVLLRSGYEDIKGVYAYEQERELAMERLDHLQRFLGSRFRILPKTGERTGEKELAEYLLAEKTRPDVFFVSSLEHKVALVDLAQRNGVELQHEIRTPDNRREHSDFSSFYLERGYEYRAYPDCYVEGLQPNEIYHPRSVDERDVLKRFVEWKVIKLDIRD